MGDVRINPDRITSDIGDVQTLIEIWRNPPASPDEHTTPFAAT
jgi:hypothetical protein